MVFVDEPDSGRDRGRGTTFESREQDFAAAVVEHEHLIAEVCAWCLPFRSVCARLCLHDFYCMEEYVVCV